MKNNKKILLLIMTLAVLTIIMMGSVSAADQTIKNTTKGGLQTAIKNVGTGQTIYLENGVYSCKYNTNLTISKSLTISGKGNSVVIDAQGKNIIFNIRPGVKVTLKNLKLINGKKPFSVETAYDDATFFSLNGGGAIYNNGALSVDGCTFTNNQATDGGAIYSDGSLSLNGCTFTNNQASFGGAIWSDGSLSVDGCTFTNNQAGSGSGAIIGRNITIIASDFNNNGLTELDSGIFVLPNGTLVIDSFTSINNMKDIDYNINEYNTIYLGPNAKVYKKDVAITLADLTITKIQKKGNYRYMTIKNIGKKSTDNNFYLDVYVSKKRIKTVLVKSLGVGKSATVKVLIAKKYRNSLKTFKVDITNRVNESNEKNNSRNAR